jgi:hypothetical protein
MTRLQWGCSDEEEDGFGVRMEVMVTVVTVVVMTVVLLMRMTRMGYTEDDDKVGNGDEGCAGGMERLSVSEQCFLRFLLQVSVPQTTN